MRYFSLIFLCIITFVVKAQNNPDSIKWDLSSNDSVSSSTFNLRGKQQNLANNIPPANYINGYEKVTAPTAGWPSVANLSNSFIEFPFSTQPDVCYDTTGGYHYCIAYNYFSPVVLKLTGYVSQVSDSVAMDVYFCDTSCYAAYSGLNYKYLGSIAIKSYNDLQPTNVGFALVQQNDNKLIQACGAGGKYSTIRLYPRTGGDLFIRNIIVAGSTAILLPIEFTYLKALVKNETVVLSWGIENIHDIQKFIIEKSADGILFSEADNINTLGTSYNWIDKYPFESNNFYRVKAVEKTGKAIFSEVVKVNNPLNPAIIISPNPVIGKKLQFSIKNGFFGEYLMTVSNEMGQNVFSVFFSYTGESRKTIDLPKQIVPGVYFIRIENGKQKWNKKVIVL